jgi:hypothetical protein
VDHILNEGLGEVGIGDGGFSFDTTGAGFQGNGFLKKGKVEEEEGNIRRRRKEEGEEGGGRRRDEEGRGKSVSGDGGFSFDTDGTGFQGNGFLKKGKEEKEGGREWKEEEG